ncbi:MAG: hypothetical protein HYY64_14850 [Candidatus Rokubacteria bacterium]|nr:hypothetical protein [Candidatus Rokubacteria bacterium]
MRITERSGLGAVAVAVGDALRRHGIKAVLSGGACASLYSRGMFQSADMDFVLTGPAKQVQLDAAMATLGFTRKGDRYVGSRTRFYVEFPRGPLAIGNDYEIRPVTRRTPHGRAAMLSPTDSCRDRLAAFYHWNDRQSLRVAAWIALGSRVHLPAVRRWSVAEGFADRFEEFLAEVKRARVRREHPGRRR